jgi:hypothetical protein
MDGDMYAWGKMVGETTIWSDRSCCVHGWASHHRMSASAFSISLNHEPKQIIHHRSEISRRGNLGRLSICT